MFIASRHMQLKRMSNLKLLLFLFVIFFFISFGYSSSSSSNNAHKCSVEQRDALLSFKQNVSPMNPPRDHYHNVKCKSTRSRYYPIMLSWNMSIDCCNWDGVTCNHFTGDVVGLDLSCSMLEGTIHPNSTLFNLPRLERLNLAFNTFISSPLPREIGRFSNSLTHLNISDCGFGGQVPTDITLLHKLVSLDLSRNFVEVGFHPHVFYNLLQNCTLLSDLILYEVNISSSFPNYLNNSFMKSLNLERTGLQGKLPDNIFNLQHLENLELSRNFELTGLLPKVNSSSNLPLKWLDLSFTGLSQEIPESFGHFKSLNTLLIRDCDLTGPLPKSLVNFRHLTTLDLSNNRLNGSISSKLFSLTHLTYLDLSFNNLRGEWELDVLLSSLTTLVALDLSYSGLTLTTNNDNHYVNPEFQSLRLASCKLRVFPESLRAMKNLGELDLSSNEIHGYIPDWAGEIGGNGLYHLNLSHNFITRLPQLPWKELRYLDLRSNLIQGPFPPSICNMNKLWFLDMSNNNFDGVIPQCFGYISSSLRMIDMGSNHFHGTIPNVYENCDFLDGLVLNGNQLEGEVPSWLSKCGFLKVLDLGNNRLSGTFPDWLGNLQGLQVLVLASNKMQGPIGSSFMNDDSFSRLKVLDISRNKFVGHLPGIYFQNFGAMKNVVKKGTIPEYLSIGGKFYSMIAVVKDVPLPFAKILVDYTIVDLSDNKFEGEIPNVIGSLNSLIVLNLSHNNLNGQIPYALGNLSEIESLDLSWNQLIGKIPQSLADITSLEVLNLSQNHLVGRIPGGKQFNTFDVNSFVGNPRLCGFPLPKHCEHVSAPQPEAEEDEESGFTWKVVMLGYGCGTLVGLAMGYLMLSTGRPMWFNAIANAGEHAIRTRQTKRRCIYIGK